MSEYDVCGRPSYVGFDCGCELREEAVIVCIEASSGEGCFSLLPLAWSRSMAAAVVVLFYVPPDQGTRPYPGCGGADCVSCGCCRYAFFWVELRVTCLLRACSEFPVQANSQSGTCSLGSGRSLARVT